jgi:F-type H+-transporting ATPase subunit b
MLIDWFTVVAQTLNFLVLVWLLRRFLYKPILEAIDAREKNIASELADAAAKQVEAGKEREDYQRKNEEFDKQRAELLTKATDAANVEKQRLLAETREAADIMSSKRLEALNNDADSLIQAITRRTQDEVFSIARKTLADLADTRLERSMVDVFIHLLREMDGDSRSDLADALNSPKEPALVRSAFRLPDELRAEIQTAINETFSAEVHLQFETSPDLVSGIELSANGRKVAWTISDYLASLEQGVDALLEPKAKPDPDTVMKSETTAEPQSGAAMP